MLILLLLLDKEGAMKILSKLEAPVATQTDDGLMDSEDKEKLDGVQEGAVAITIGTQQPLVGLWFEEYI